MLLPFAFAFAAFNASFKMTRHRLQVAKQTDLKLSDLIGESALARGLRRQFRQWRKWALLGPDPAAQPKQAGKPSN
jgi:hypothetical protein